MALEADCGSSTVLEELRVASTRGFFVPGECRGTATTASTFPLSLRALRRNLRASGTLTRGSGRRAQSVGVWAAFRIPNSELDPWRFVGLAMRPF